ncbi:peptidoglycan-binding domain-containing protein, partial [Streptomyces sp. NPDC049577]|uniref:peptidoglycan-binding domain-containing protein n=1 Tax=Streptomyces sp. NPDC049577 TaxID=3155153 RepID=UPI0034144946
PPGADPAPAPPAPGGTGGPEPAPPPGDRSDPRPPGQPPAPPPAPAPRPPDPQPPAPPQPPQPPQKPAPAPPWKSCRHYSGTALTQYGDKGDRVRQVQCILKARGYDIGPHGVDGDFGPDTRTAVKRFQKAHHLDADGQVGKDTWPALRG